LIYFASIFLLLTNPLLGADESKPQPVRPASTEQFQIRNIEGWTVYIKKQDLIEHTAGMNKAIEHLQNQIPTNFMPLR